jgi:hypothetical protein
MLRANIKQGDVDLDQVVGLCPAEGWVAVYSTNEQRPLLAWVVLKDGQWIGLVGEEPQGRVLRMEVRAADMLLNFTNYKHL